MLLIDRARALACCTAMTTASSLPRCGRRRGRRATRHWELGGIRPGTRRECSRRVPSNLAWFSPVQQRRHAPKTPTRRRAAGAVEPAGPRPPPRRRAPRRSRKLAPTRMGAPHDGTTVTVDDARAVVWRRTSRFTLRGARSRVLPSTRACSTRRGIATSIRRTSFPTNGEGGLLRTTIGEIPTKLNGEAKRAPPVASDFVSSVKRAKQRAARASQCLFFTSRPRPLQSASGISRSPPSAAHGRSPQRA